MMFECRVFVMTDGLQEEGIFTRECSLKVCKSTAAVCSTRKREKAKRIDEKSSLMGGGCKMTRCTPIHLISQPHSITCRLQQG